MLTATLLTLLCAVPEVPSGFLGDSAPRRIRLVADTQDAPASAYQGWSRQQLRVEYDRLDALRPKLFWPITFVIVGGTGLVFTALGLAVGLSSFFGLSVVVAVVLAIAVVVSAGLVAWGTILLVRGVPERREIGTQLDLIQGAYDDLSPYNPRNMPAPSPCPSDIPVDLAPQVRFGPTYPITLAVF